MKISIPLHLGGKLLKCAFDPMGTDDWEPEALISEPWPRPIGVGPNPHSNPRWLCGTTVGNFWTATWWALKAYSNPVTNWPRISVERDFRGSHANWTLAVVELVKHGQFNKPIYLWKPKCISIVGHGQDVTEIKLKFSNKSFAGAVTWIPGLDLSQQQWN